MLSFKYRFFHLLFDFFDMCNTFCYTVIVAYIVNYVGLVIPVWSASLCFYLSILFVILQFVCKHLMKKFSSDISN